DDGVVAFLFQIEVQSGADPFPRSLEHSPAHAPGRVEFEDLHLEAADFDAFGAEAKAQVSADLGVAAAVPGPPAGDALGGGQCLVNLVGGRLDADPMQDV